MSSPEALDSALAAIDELEGDPKDLDRVRATALLTRANMYRTTGDLDRTQEVLDEVMQLVEGRSDYVERRAISSQCGRYYKKPL